jgi:uncharacterized protein YkwD
MPLSADGATGSGADVNPMPRPAVRFVALAALVLSLAVPFAASAGAAAAPLSNSMQALQADLLVQINDFRRAHGLAPFRLSSKLTLAARQHSSEMAARGYFSHNSVNGSSFDRRIARFYPVRRGYWSVGENLLWSSPDVDAADALRMWLNSPEHRANLMRAGWREIGIAAVHAVSAPGLYGGREVTIVTTDFGVRR